MIKRTASLLTALLLLCAFVLSAAAVSESDANMISSLNSKHIVVTCAENSQIVLSKGENALTAPAASAKLMTALLVAEYMADTGKDIKTTTVIIPKAATQGFAGVASVGLRENEELTVEELLYALLVSNANDACVALAITVAGSEDDFVQKMNNKATALGALNTKYVNSTGLDAAKNGVTTAYDTSLILSAFYKHNELVEMTKVARYEMRATNKSSARPLNNKNHIVSKTLISKYYNPEAVGLMYTYTEAAGHCLFTAVQKDELTFLLVLMDAESLPVSSEDKDFIMAFSDASSLFNWCSGFGYQTLISSSELLGQVAITMSGSSEAVSYHPSETVEFLVKTADFDATKIEKLVKLTEQAKIGFEAPVLKDAEVGTVEVWYDGKLMGELPLVLTSGVDRSELLFIWSKVQAVLFSSEIKTAAIIFVSLVALYIILVITLKIIKAVKKAKRKKQRKLDAKNGKKRVYYYVDEDDDDDDDDEFYE